MEFLFGYLIIGMMISSILCCKVVNSLVSIFPEEYKNNFITNIQIFSVITLLWLPILLYCIFGDS